jgi:hypothetical protein
MKRKYFALSTNDTHSNSKMTLEYAGRRRRITRTSVAIAMLALSAVAVIFLGLPGRLAQWADSRRLISECAHHRMPPSGLIYSDQDDPTPAGDYEFRLDPWPHVGYCAGAARRAFHISDTTAFLGTLHDPVAGEQLVLVTLTPAVGRIGNREYRMLSLHSLVMPPEPSALTGDRILRESLKLFFATDERVRVIAAPGRSPASTGFTLEIVSRDGTTTVRCDLKGGKLTYHFSDHRESSEGEGLTIWKSPSAERVTGGVGPK